MSMTLEREQTVDGSGRASPRRAGALRGHRRHRGGDHTIGRSRRPGRKPRRRCHLALRRHRRHQSSRHPGRPRRRRPRRRPQVHRDRRRPPPRPRSGRRQDRRRWSARRPPRRFQHRTAGSDRHCGRSPAGNAQRGHGRHRRRRRPSRHARRSAHRRLAPDRRDAASRQLGRPARRCPRRGHRHQHDGQRPPGIVDSELGRGAVRRRRAPRRPSRLARHPRTRRPVAAARVTTPGSC